MLLLQGLFVLLFLDDVFKHPNESRISFPQRNPPKHPWKIYNGDKNFLLRILGFFLNSPPSQPKQFALLLEGISPLLVSFINYFSLRRGNILVYSALSHVFHCEYLKSQSILPDFVIEFE